MIKVYLRKFELADAEQLAPMAIEPVDITPQWRAMIERNAQCGPAYTAYLGDVPIYAGGIVLGRDGVGNLWGMASQKIRRNTKEFLRSLRQILAILIDTFDLKKVRCLSLPNAAQRRLIEHLGFVRMRRNRIKHEHYCYIWRRP